MITVEELTKGLERIDTLHEKYQKGAVILLVFEDGTFIQGTLDAQGDLSFDKNRGWITPNNATGKFYLVSESPNPYAEMLREFEQRDIPIDEDTLADMEAIGYKIVKVDTNN